MSSEASVISRDRALGFGRTYYNQGKYEDAIEMFKQAIHADPKHDIAWGVRGSAKRMLGRHNEAILDFNEAIRLNPRNDSALQERGESKRMLGRYEEAVQDFNEAIRLNPKSDWAKKHLEETKKQQGNVKIKELNKEAHEMGSTFFQQKKFAEAIQCFDREIARDPKNDTAWSMRGASKRMLGRYEEALQDCNEAVRLNPNSTLGWGMVGEVKQLQGRYEEAIQAFNVAIKLDPQNEVPKRHLEEAKKQLESKKGANKGGEFLTRGLAELRAGRYAEAIQECNEAIKLDPKSDLAWYCRGASKRMLSRYVEAIQDLNEAIKLNAQRSEAWQERGEAKRMLGRNEEAIQDYNEVIKLNPKAGFGWQGRGSAKRMLGRNEEAIQDFNEAIKLNPKSELSWQERGSAKRMLGRNEEAMQDYNEAMKLNSASFFSLQERGELKRVLGRYEEAIQDCDEAIKLNPKSDFAWLVRGLTKQRMSGRGEEALRDFQEAVRLNPKNDSAKKQIDEAKKKAEDEKQQQLARAQSKILSAKGSVEQGANRHEEAILTFSEVIKLDPKNDSAWGNRGRSKLMLSRNEEALKDCDEAIKLNSKTSDAWWIRGAAKVSLGRYEEAIKDCNEAIKLNPKYDFVWSNRGEAKLKLGRYEEAAKDLSEATRLNPANDFAKKLLDEATKKISGQKPEQSKPQEKPSAPPVTSNPVFGHQIKVSMAIPKEQLKFERRLGEGSFGEVHKGVWSPTSLFKIPVAIKKLKNTSMSAKVLEDFKREVEIQAKLDSSGVVKLYGITADQPYCMVMEFMEQGSLRDLLDAQKPEVLQWDIRIQMAGNMVRGLAYLHGQNPVIIHGDLKSLNILVNSKGEAKLADFGLAALKTESRSKEYVGGNTGNNKGPKGSLLWIAPELFRMNAKRTPATDIFSLAVVFWELASHLFPYESAHGDVQLIQSWVEKGEREAFDERTPNTPKEYSELTQRCWDAKPENRPNAKEVAAKLETLYSSTPLAPTMFSSGSQGSSTPARSQSMNSGGYMANTATATASAPAKGSGVSQPTSTLIPPKNPYMGNVYK